MLYAKRSLCGRKYIQLINFNIMFGLSLTLICSTSNKKLFIVDSGLKASNCDSATYFAKLQEPMVGYHFCLFKGKINSNTNIHLDLRQPLLSIGLNEYLLLIVFRLAQFDCNLICSPDIYYQRILPFRSVMLHSQGRY